MPKTKTKINKEVKKEVRELIKKVVATIANERIVPAADQIISTAVSDLYGRLTNIVSQAEQNYAVLKLSEALLKETIRQLKEFKPHGKYAKETEK